MKTFANAHLQLKCGCAPLPRDQCRRCGATECLVHWKDGPPLCEKHNRFRQMRKLCQERGLDIPSWSALEALAMRDVADLRCPVCRKLVRWRTGNGYRSPKSDIITLQHDRSGALRLICHTCNQHHYTYPNDDFYKTPHLVCCSECRKPKNPCEFALLDTRCRACNRERKRRERGSVHVRRRRTESIPNY
jgi:hypothetical protein